MPITQDRFLEVIEGAAVILEIQKAIRRLTSNSASAISNANSFLDRTEDPIAKSIVENLISTLYSVQDHLNNNSVLEIELAAIILAEKRHFAKNEKRNVKAAMRQREARNQNPAITLRQNRDIPTDVQGSIQSHERIWSWPSTPSVRSEIHEPSAKTPAPNQDPNQDLYSDAEALAQYNARTEPMDPLIQKLMLQRAIDADWPRFSILRNFGPQGPETIAKMKAAQAAKAEAEAKAKAERQNQARAEAEASEIHESYGSHSISSPGETLLDTALAIERQIARFSEEEKSRIRANNFELYSRLSAQDLETLSRTKPKPSALVAGPGEEIYTDTEGTRRVRKIRLTPDELPPIPTLGPSALGNTRILSPSLKPES